MNLNDLAFRHELAEGICAALFERQGIRATVTELKCPDCPAWLIEFERQQIPFCWDCTVNRNLAHQARTLLTVASLASDGIIMEPTRAPLWPEKVFDPEDRSSWPAGAAL